MNDFKVGDRVEYFGPMQEKRGKTYTIKGFMSGTADVGEDLSFGPLLRNLRLITRTPDVITINRADLPEVLDNPNGFTVGGFGYACDLTSSQRREHALRLLALAEFLEAREKTAEEAKTKLDKRRDELAKEVAKRACYVNYQNFTYEDHVPAAQAAINMFIELEDPRG